MTSKQRFLVAMRNGKPDRVPCAPDISNYIPCKHTGLPFWEIYFDEVLPLWEAYVAVALRYGIDMWVAASAGIPLTYAKQDFDVNVRCSYDSARDAMLRTTEYKTPEGMLEHQEICYRNEPPMHVKRLLGDPEREWDAFRYLIREPDGIDLVKFGKIRSACEQHGHAFGLTMGYPGFHMWEGSVEGSISTLSYLASDNPAFLDRWFEMDLAVGTKALELYLAEKPDYVLFGGSGTLTMSSPALVMKYAIPALKLWTSMARESGVATMLHSCGKSRLLVDLLVEHTCLDCINPLEMPPMGDVLLPEVKAAHGKNIALMGNLHTVDTMLYGSSEDVYRAAEKAIQAAALDGGFIMSTGDQCPLDTPDENLHAMVQAAKDFGTYQP
jgi:uroporphyrinogen decarboxylase